MNEPIGRFGILQPRARAPQRVRDRLDSLILADDALVQPLLHVDELLDLALEQPGHRNPRPRGHDCSDVILVDLFLHHRRLGALLALDELLLELGENPVLDLGDAGEVPGTLLAVGLHAQLVDLPLDVGHALQRVLLARPARGELVSHALRVRELALEWLADALGLVRHRRELDLELAHTPVGLVELDG